MNVLAFETCWAKNIINQVTSVGLSLFNYQGDARSNKHKIRNCFTLATTNKLSVIINSLKLPKIKKILLYEMKYLVPNYNCLQNSWLGGYHPQIPVLSVLTWICWTPPKQNSWVCHCHDCSISAVQGHNERLLSVESSLRSWQILR